jgi:hypothetical protein
LCLIKEKKKPKYITVVMFKNECERAFSLVVNVPR